MTNNESLRAIRFLLNVSDAKLGEITALGGYAVTDDEIVSYLKVEGEEGYEPCPDSMMAHFLNGLVIHKRGVDPSRPALPVEVPVSNNLVLKRLRVAFQLRDTDLILLIQKSGLLTVTATELSAFFRNRDHRNYRECGDQFLRNVLRALSI